MLAATIVIPGVGFVLSILIAFACGAIARSKGRHSVGWTILGFFFSLIALLVIAVLPRKN